MIFCISLGQNNDEIKAVYKLINSQAEHDGFVVCLGLDIYSVLPHW